MSGRGVEGAEVNPHFGRSNKIQKKSSAATFVASKSDFFSSSFKESTIRGDTSDLMNPFADFRRDRVSIVKCLDGGEFSLKSISSDERIVCCLDSMMLEGVKFHSKPMRVFNPESGTVWQ